MAKQKKRSSEEFIMLDTLENFNLWGSSTNDSELTFYRRFAELLDILFNGTDFQFSFLVYLKQLKQLNIGTLGAYQPTAPTYTRSQQVSLKKYKTVFLALLERKFTGSSLLDIDDDRLTGLVDEEIVKEIKVYTDLPPFQLSEAATKLLAKLGESVPSSRKLRRIIRKSIGENDDLMEMYDINFIESLIKFIDCYSV